VIEKDPSAVMPPAEHAVPVRLWQRVQWQ
jgi:hypothetical protein